MNSPTLDSTPDFGWYHHIEALGSLLPSAFSRNAPGLSRVNRILNGFMKKLSIACGLLIASGSLFAQQYSIGTIAGTGTAGWSGDLGPALSAQFDKPIRVALDGAGNIYITDQANSSIREVFTNGTVNSVTGNGSPGLSGDGKSAVGAQLASPNDIALDASMTSEGAPATA